MKPSVFVGGTSEGASFTEFVQERLTPFARCVVWNKGVFEVAGTNQNSLLSALRQSDFAVLILTADAIIEDRGKLFFSPRDNLLFEAGIAFGAIAPDRTFLIPENLGELKIPSDLAGFTLTKRFDRSSHSAGLSAAVEQIRSVIRQKGARPLRRESVAKSFLRSQNLQLIKNADRSIVMFGRDLSWVPDYLNEIRNAVQRHVSVDVVCEVPQNDAWRRNVDALTSAGANVHQTDKDLGLRLTFIDREDDKTAQFIFSAKERQGDAVVYQYEMHDARSSRVLWQTLSRLHEAVCLRAAQ